jgi:hypothetical protein
VVARNEDPDHTEYEITENDVMQIENRYESPDDPPVIIGV